MDARELVLVCAASILASLVAVFGLAGCLAEPEINTSKPSGRSLYVSTSSDCGGRRPCHNSIQDAVDAASEGDVIKVSRGIYTATAPQVVSIKKSIHLVGGYRADDWSLPRPDDEPTVIDAEQVSGRRGVFIDGRGVSTVTVKGFRITHGDAPEPGGGGVYVAGGSVVLEENAIEACTAEARGGGLFIADGRVHLRNSVLQRNAAQYGGGVYVQGGSVVLDRNTIVNNEAPPMGGALAIDGGRVAGANNVVAENTLAGAGVYLSGGHLTASHWTLVSNGRYGVIVDLGLDIDSGSAALSQSIVASHAGGLCGAGAVARQTLFYRVDDPCIAGASCMNNLFGDPRFVDPSAGDYHIAADSAAIDRGHSLDVACDIDGDLRPVGTASDIGADEIEPYRAYLPLIVRGDAPRRP